MKRFLTYIFILLTLLSLSAKEVCAEDKIAGESATLNISSEAPGFDYRVVNLNKFLTKYNSPLADYSEEFVAFADTYGIDYRLVPAITGVESTFGKHIPYKSFNAYGWANGEYSFSSWEDSIDHVSMTLKTKYIDKGAPSITKIAHRYAPPSTTWGTKVAFFVSKIDALPLTFDI